MFADSHRLITIMDIWTIFHQSLDTDFEWTTCGFSICGNWLLIKWKWKSLVMSDSLPPHGLYNPWNSPGQNSGVGSLSLLQGICPTQGLNPGLPHCRWILYQLSYQRSPRILEWVAYRFSSGSSQRRNWSGISCTAGRLFTNWALREPEHGLNAI